MRFLAAPGFLLLTIAFAFGASEVRPIPPLGIEITADDRAQLESGLRKLDDEIARLSANELLPDVLIYSKAVHFALDLNEIYKPEEVGRAKELLAEGSARAEYLRRGQSPWTTATGLVLRGYISGIDGSVQPYGLVVPRDWSPESEKAWRLDAWFHGRSENLTEINFLWSRERDRGEFTPPQAFVLHLYGRYCNASKFAGETDFFEALANAESHYRIDPRRIVIRGFSMGGASAWQFGTHYAGLWAAVAPGAGFAETPEFVHLKEQQPSYVARPWEEKLWHWTNATDYALNLYNVPVVAYNGDHDPQRQAADIMERALAEDGMHLARVWGLDAGHKYTPEAKTEIDRIVDAAAGKGSDPAPKHVRLTTFTLAYNQMKWVTVDALDEHWRRARVTADVTDGHTMLVSTQNVAALTFSVPPASGLLDPAGAVTVRIDGGSLVVPGPMTDGSWTVSLHREGLKWRGGALDAGLRKRHGLQGPIDDAFTKTFLIVRPTGAAGDAHFAAWQKSEMERAIGEWKREFRGDARVKDDRDVTAEDIASANLVLWGDPASNSVLARVAGDLPIAWPREPDRALILIYPNPLNPARYVVLNSGFTFREQQYLNNAWQVARLPDWALIDLTTPPDANWPGRVVDAGFFDERWKLPVKHAR